MVEEEEEEEGGGDLLVVGLYLEETAEATMVELLTMQGQTFGHHCRARRVIRYRPEETAEGGVVMSPE